MKFFWKFATFSKILKMQLCRFEWGLHFQTFFDNTCNVFAFSINNFVQYIIKNKKLTPSRIFWRKKNLVTFWIRVYTLPKVNLTSTKHQFTIFALIRSQYMHLWVCSWYVECLPFFTLRRNKIFGKKKLRKIFFCKCHQKIMLHN